MSGRLAIDFGTSNTVIAVWDEVQEEGIPLHLPGYGRFLKQEDERISLIPSLIHYSSDGKHSIGNQVLQRNFYHTKQTFRWFKRYITNRSPIRMRVGDRRISYDEAGKAFLGRVLKVAGQKLNIGDEEIALTVPVEAFEHYENWLTEVAAAAGMPRFRLIDEPSAAALGYGLSIQPGDSYLIFDFGGGTLDVAVVLIEEEQEIESGRYCRVLGKAGLDIGGATIDQWLFQEVLQQNYRRDTDEDVMQISNALLVECERAKERLSFYERADISVVNPETGGALWAELTRRRFEEILEQHEAFRQINWTIRRALNAAHERGYREDQIKAVLMVGGSSQIPSVRRTLQRMFGHEKVKLNRPLDAVARGAAVFVAGMGFYDYIQHDYAIRFGTKGKKYKYHTIVEHGTPYPTSKALARLSVKASYPGQTQLGLAIFEITAERPKTVSQGIELVFDPSGAARMVQLTPKQEERRHYFWMNEGNPTFLTANPPAEAGEKRFQVEFSIDGNKRLLITVRDLKTGRLTHQNYPVVKLT